MSLAKIFGGGKKKDAAPTTQEAIQKLRETEEMLIKKSDFLEQKIKGEVLTAKKAGSKNKRVAIAALKRKKRLEKQLQTIDNTLSTIELQRETLEYSNTSIESVKALQDGAKALKNVTRQLSVDDINDLMDDINEEMQIQNEIGESLAGMGAAFSDDIDEDELLEELNELEEEDIDSQLLGADLPNVPTTALPEVPTITKEKKAKEEGLSELEAWAS